jgi:alkylation response protein AidB-like acyl-CoA dehydrogenase
MPHPYGIDEPAAAFAARAATIANEILAPNATDVDAQGRFPKESIAALAEAGFLGLCVPKDLGGLGQGMRAFAAVTEELARACGSTAMVYVMHVSASQVIAASKTLAARDETLRAIAKGLHLTTLAFSEKGSRSQFWAPVSKLAENGQGFVTNAKKSWVTSAGAADSYVSSGLRPGAASPLESTLYLVKRSAAGVRVAGPFQGLGLRGNDSSPVDFANVAIATGDLLTPLGEGAAAMLQVALPWFNVGTAAMANGVCRAAIAATAAHLQAGSFEHSGTKLRDLPNLRARLAAMSVRCEQSRALLGMALGEIEAGSEVAPLFVLQTRLAAIEAAAEVTDLAMQCCGGAAFSKQLPVERLFRDARAGCVMAPTSDHLQDFIGKALTGLPLF